LEFTEDNVQKYFLQLLKMKKIEQNNQDNFLILKERVQRAFSSADASILCESLSQGDDFMDYLSRVQFENFDHE
jgi:hypothetical protein